MEIFFLQERNSTETNCRVSFVLFFIWLTRFTMSVMKGLISIRSDIDASAKQHFASRIILLTFFLWLCFLFREKRQRDGRKED